MPVSREAVINPDAATPETIVFISQAFILTQGCDTEIHRLRTGLVSLTQAFTEEAVAINATS